MLFAERAVSTFGMMCAFLNPDDLDEAGPLLGALPVRDPAVAERFFPGGNARVWTLLHSGMFMTLAHREQDGACTMRLVGSDPGILEGVVDRMVRALRGPRISVSREEVPRGLPSPALRARYRLSASDGGGVSILELHVETDRSQPPGGVLLLRGATP